MSVILKAKSRLQAALSDSDHTAKENIDHSIDNKQEQVKQLKKSMPSRQNRMSVSPDQRNRTEKQINDTKSQESDLRLKKSKIGN